MKNEDINESKELYALLNNLPSYEISDKEIHQDIIRHNAREKDVWNKSKNNRSLDVKQTAEENLKLWQERCSGNIKLHNHNYTEMDAELEKRALNKKNKKMLQYAKEPTEDDWTAFSAWLDGQLEKCSKTYKNKRNKK